MTTYSITLDDVDLALLPLRTHKYNDFLKKEHFQFQVMKTDINEEPEPTIFYKCHICGTEVPAAFAREHNTSIKHRANARIASVAAERTRALITALPPPTCAQPTARFCANCANVVGKNHDKTKSHRVAVMQDKLLWELMTAYVGYGDGDENYSDYSEPEYITPDSDVKKESGNSQDCNDDESYGPEWSEPEYIPTDSGTEKGTGSQNCKGFEPWDKVHGQEEKQNISLNTTETIKEINKNDENEENRRTDDKKNENVDNKIEISNKPDNIKSSNSEIKLSEKTVNIESTNRETEIIPNDHDSAIRKTEPITKGEECPISIQPKDTNCQVNKELETSTNLDAPSIKPKATENVKLEYIEFVTKDNKQVKVFSDYYHSFTRKVDTITCKVCSSTFKNEDVLSHMFTLNHLNKMPTTLINEHCVRQINDTYSHCILCNQMVKNSNVTKHYLTIGHGRGEKQAVTDTNQATTSKIAKTVNRDVDSANIFINAKAANTNVKPKTPEIAQNAPNEAKSSIDWPVIYPYEVTDQENTVRCLICDCKVPNNPDNRKCHLLGGNHAKNVKNKRNLYPFENTARDGVARCVICDVKVTISPENLKGHLTGLNHAKSLIRKDSVRMLFELWRNSSMKRGRKYVSPK